MSLPYEHDHAHPTDDDPHGEGSEDTHDGHGDHAGDADAHGSHDGHAGSEALGPLDGRAWAAAIAGGALALIVVVALYLTISA